MQYCDLCRRQ
ncbi:hypothetical protein LINGRAHAP2_LOCUS29553 [Linum grandiflorum]